MKSFLVIGLGKFGRSCAKELCNLGHDVLGVDENLRLVNEASSYLTHTVQADSTDEDFLKSIAVNEFDSCIVAIGDNQESSVMITVLLKEHGAKNIIAKAQSEVHAKILEKVGADKVILPEYDMGIKLAHTLCNTSIYDLIDISPEHSIISIKAPKEWIGKTLGNLSAREKYGVNIIAIESELKEANVFPTANTVINKNDTIIVIGVNDDLTKLKNM